MQVPPPRVASSWLAQNVSEPPASPAPPLKVQQLVRPDSVHWALLLQRRSVLVPEQTRPPRLLLQDAAALHEIEVVPVVQLGTLPPVTGMTAQHSSPLGQSVGELQSVPPEPDPELLPELDPDEDPELEPEEDPEEEPEEEPDEEPELDPEEEPELPPELDPDEEPELEPEEEPELEADPLPLPVPESSPPSSVPPELVPQATMAMAPTLVRTTEASQGDFMPLP